MKKATNIAHCSAIYSTHEKVDGQPVGQHATIVRVLKGTYNKRPLLPKYSTTWEVSKVTSYIISLGGNNVLSLKLFSLIASRACGVVSSNKAMKVK